jgi:hypothetical protein
MVNQSTTVENERGSEAKIVKNWNSYASKVNELDPM